MKSQELYGSYQEQSISMIEQLRSLLSINYQTNYQHAKISDAVLKEMNKI